MQSDGFWDSERSSIFAQIAEKRSLIREKIECAARRSGRNSSDVLLVAVSKYAEPNDGIVEGFLRSGLFDLAENRVQRFLEKVEFWRQSKFWNGSNVDVPFLSDKVPQNKIRWHFIGALQRNKVRRVLPYVSLIHSVDSWKLLEMLNRVLEEENEGEKNVGDPQFPNVVSVLLESHISNDETKQGLTPDEIVELLPKAANLKHVRVCGLMGMAGLTASPDEVRRQFESLRLTLERCRKEFPDFKELRELSMGMSGDFEIAIEEGATIVRIGSSLYPERK